MIRLKRQTAAVVPLLLTVLWLPLDTARASQDLKRSLAPTQGIENYFFTHPSGGSSPARTSADVLLVADRGNGLLVVMKDSASCAAGDVTTAVFDMRDRSLVRAGCAQGASHFQDPRIKQSASSESAGNHIAVRAAIDSRRAMMFLPTGGVFSNEPPQIVGFNERTLKVRSVWTLPLGSGYHVSGMSVNAAHDELIVAVDDGSQQPVGPGPGPPVGVTIYAYNLTDALASPDPQPRYSYRVVSCQRGDAPQVTPNAPFRSHSLAKLLVPCTIASSLTQTTSGPLLRPPPKTGIVSVVLDADGKPTGDESVALAPAPATSLLYDAGSERAFLTYDGPNGPLVFGYDARRGAFIGRTAVGDANDRAVGSVGLDEATGRLYGVGATGLYVVDGRRTPLSVGSSFKEFAGVGQTRAIVAFPPLPGVPYTQVVVPVSRPKCQPFNSDPATFDRLCGLPTIPVYTDRLPVSVDPPLADLDGNTFSGPIGAGDTVSSTYGANARGYGVHSAYVGNASATIDNSTAPGTASTLGLPFTAGNNDQLSAYVSRLSLANGVTEGAAAAVADGSGATTSDYHQQFGEKPYPFPLAECSHPGPSAKAVGQADGYATGGDPKDPDTTGTSAQAHALVRCTPTSSATASGEAHYAGTQTAGSPSFGYGASRTVASVLAPKGSRGAEARVTSSVAGFVVDFGAGNRLSIGEVQHQASAGAAGRPGTATASHVVRIRNVSLTVAGVETALCIGLCPADPQGLIAQINAAYPALLHVMEPRPFDTLLRGTPRGYIAGVQAELAQVYGDQQYNQMSAAESTLLPALRIIVYNDGGANNREIIDLAGVQVDAQLGIDVIKAGVYGPPPPLAEQERASGGPPLVLSPAQPSADGFSDAPAVVANPLARLLRKAFAGLGWLARNPAEAARVLGFLVLLAAPLLLMDRRRRWVADVLEARS